jgi:hypothetical protein
MRLLTLTSLSMAEKLSIVAKSVAHRLRHGKRCINTKLKIIRIDAIKLII